MASGRNPPQITCAEKADWYNSSSRLAREIHWLAFPSKQHRDLSDPNLQKEPIA